METEELIRSHPVDGVVLMGGCDKTTPALLMGAFSCNLPAIFIPAGRSSNASFKGQKVGTGTHTMKFWNERRAGGCPTTTGRSWKRHDAQPRHLQHRWHCDHHDGRG